MFNPNEMNYYLIYFFIIILLILFFYKITSSDKNSLQSSRVSTTNEFQVFQRTFLTGFSLMIFAELVSIGSFYKVFLSIHLEISQIIRLYIITLFSNLIGSFFMELFEFESHRPRSRCLFVCILFLISCFIVLFGGNYEMLCISRVFYGIATSMMQVYFESYAQHQHANSGYPDEWLHKMFSSNFTHVLTLISMLSGITGEFSSSLGVMGPIVFCIILSSMCILYIFTMWKNDGEIGGSFLSSTRSLLAPFQYNLNQLYMQIKSPVSVGTSKKTNENVFSYNRNLIGLLLISSIIDSIVSIFMFIWAPFLHALTLSCEVSGQSSLGFHHIPYLIIYSTLMGAMILGSYSYNVYLQLNSSDSSVSTVNSSFHLFKLSLICLAILFFILFCITPFHLNLGATSPESSIDSSNNNTSSFLFAYSSPLSVSVAFIVMLFIQFNIGIYTSSVGYFRGKILHSNTRSISLLITKLLAFVLSFSLLSFLNLSPFLLTGFSFLFVTITYYIGGNFINNASLYSTQHYDIESDDDDRI